MGHYRIYNTFISLLRWEAGAQKWEVFAQFWEAMGRPTSHIFIEYQWVRLKWGKRKKLRSEKRWEIGKVMNVKTKCPENIRVVYMPFEGCGNGNIRRAKFRLFYVSLFRHHISLQNVVYMSLPERYKYCTFTTQFHKSESDHSCCRCRHQVAPPHIYAA